MAPLVNWVVPGLSLVPPVILIAAWALVRNWNFGLQLLLLALCVLLSLPLGTTCVFLYTHPDIFNGAQHSPGIGLELFPLFEAWLASVCTYIAYALFGLAKRLRTKSHRNSKSAA